MYQDFINPTLGVLLLLLCISIYIVYSREKKDEEICYVADIDVNNNLTLHMSNCKKLSKIKDSHIQDYFDTYEEACEYSHLLEYKSFECSDCKPYSHLKF